ncbi:MAG: radical SAM protein [Euryarchaeota archaeon]|nr:radical SAM protein [Euryarchaeota archaeon]
MEEGKSAENIMGKNIIGVIGNFKRIVDNPVSKFLLHKTLGYCEEDGASRLETALNFYLGKKEDCCRKCKVTSKFIAYIVSKGKKSFGVSEEEFKEQMEDQYWVRGLASVLKGIATFGVKKPFVPGAPFQVVWNITRACNMRCVHCYENAGSKGEEELSQGEILKGLDILANCGVTSLAFSGGEPSIHPQILKFIQHASNKGLHVALATNGYKFLDLGECMKFAKAGLQFVQISIDGIDPETHDSFRGVSGAWDRAVDAVENFERTGIFVEVATTVTEYNFEEIPEMIKFVRRLGAHWFMLYNFIPTGKGAEIVEMDISPKKRLKILRKAYRENFTDEMQEMQILSTAPQYAHVAHNMSFEDVKIIPTHFYNPEYTNPMLIKLADFVGGCGAGRFYMSIEPNGDMYPCVFFPHEDEVKLGNLLKDDFDIVWQNNRLLINLRNKNILKGNCGVCESRNICGGCRARAYNYLNDVFAPDPGCTKNENEWNMIKNYLSHENFQKMHQNGLTMNLRN